VTAIVTSGDLAHPVFASRNWINQDSIDYGTFTADEMTALLSRIIDGDRFSYWQGSSTSDATTVTMTFSFQDRTALTRRAFDLIILQNINWKNFLIEYRNPDTGAWATVTGGDFTGTDNEDTDLIINIAAGVTADAIRITITTTMTADEAKKLGNLIVCQSAIQLSSGFENYKVKMRESLRALELGDKTISKEYLQRSAASYEFWGASFDVLFATTAELATLRTIKREGYPFILIPEPADRPEDAFQCLFDGPWGHAYENPVRSAGFGIPMKVMEVGSH
jgi:hypothetical protein